MTQTASQYLAPYSSNAEASKTAVKNDTGKSTGGTPNNDEVDAAIKSLESNAFIKAMNQKNLTWPKNILHPDMPEYKKGKLIVWAPWEKSNNDNIYILIKDTGKADLDGYIKEMEAAGFTPGNNKGYHKDLYDVTFQLNSDSILQISSYKTKVAKWPDALSRIPPIKGGALSVVEGSDEENPDSMNLYYINLPRENLEAWRKDLGAKGFDVKKDTITAKNVQFNGKTYPQAEIWYEENGTNEWNIYFEFKK